jgi:hypothetical protein
MAPAVARAALESLLRTRKLDTTLTTALPSAGPDRADRAVPIGHEALDRSLGGGIARGQISEITGLGSRDGPRWCTRCSPARRHAASWRPASIRSIDSTWPRPSPPVSSSSGCCGCVARGDSPPQALDSCHGSPPAHGRGRGVRRPSGAPSRARSRATALVLSAGGFGVVVLDLADVPRRVLGALPFTTWLRLQRLIASSDTGLRADRRSSAGAKRRRRHRAARATVKYFHCTSRHAIIRAALPRSGPGQQAPVRRLAGSGARSEPGVVWTGDQPASRRFPRAGRRCARPVGSAHGHVPDRSRHDDARRLQPVVKPRLHSTGEASSGAALLLAQILPVFSVVAPSPRGASPVSVRRRGFTTGC